MLKNQQTLEKLFTRVIMLTNMMFKVLIIITACSDLETVQMNAINTFVHCKLNKVMYMRMLSDYDVKDKILHLKKILYKLKYL